MKALFRLLLLTALAVPITAMAQGQMKHDEGPNSQMETISATHMMAQESMVMLNENTMPSFTGEAQAPAVAAPRKAATAKAPTLTPEVKTVSETICDGDASILQAPFYCNRFNNNYNTSSQWIYNKSRLQIPIGARIKSVTFYSVSAIPSNAGGATVQFRIGTTTETSIDSRDEMSSNRTSMTLVFEGNLRTGVTEEKITFTKPFIYWGDNLIFDSYVSTPGGSNTQPNWKGISATGVGRYDGGSNATRGQLNYLPKITIEYDIESSVSGNSEFFHSLTYTWKDNGVGAEHTSYMDSIATNPDQMIALLREVYMNQEIPGNWKRGFDANGKDEDGNLVSYAGVGTVTRANSGYADASYYSYNNSRGWDIPSDKIMMATYIQDGFFSDTYYYAAYMNPSQYRPYHDGLTMLLVEMNDDYSVEDLVNTINDMSFDNSYELLRAVIQNTIKSVRVITESKRTGSGLDAGTLFKIDCDKMNKFFLMAKGQVRNPINSVYWLNNENRTFCPEPAYMYTRNGSDNGWQDNDTSFPFFHMFEQFSPVTTDATATKDDIYQALVNMESFGVVHDCASIPLVGDNGHHFMMYGEDSPAADCQDVRDMMFFVPDYRMMKDDGRDPASYWKYINYNTAHQPKMGLFVIRQDTVSCPMNARHDDYYKLTLTWDSNLDEFLPSDQQEYHLLQVVQDEFGHDVYVPVYYTDEQGRYLDGPNGQPLANQNDTLHWVPIILQFSPSANKKTYTDVYVLRSSGSQQVTYAIQGQDTDGHGNHFLTLQISNRQSYIIPGKDPAEMILLSDATHYSRFNPANQTNCYSNKLKIANNPQGVKSEYLADGTKFTFKRMTSLTDTIPVTIAEATVSGAGEEGGTLNIQMYAQAPKSAFPAGKSEGIGAGYHHNEGGVDVLSWTHPYTIKTNGDIDFGKFIIFDNFVADVSANEHPNQYFYKVEFKTKAQFTGLNGLTDSAYSNSFRIPVYKIESRINATYDKTAIDTDGATATTARMTLPENVQFDEQVRRSSKTEILRYDAYRWNSENANDFFIIDEIGDEDEEQDLPPDGIAGNQGESYTVSMNAVGTPNYTTSEVSVADGTGWAEFVDKVPNSGGASPYTYAPVVESFTSGLNVKETAVRTDYNTYGGPLQKVAIGKVDIKQPTVEDKDMMASDYEWEEEGVTYCYYNVPIHINSVTLPGDEGAYEVYKVRAWRIAEESMLHEREPNGTTIPDRSDRLSGDYLFEELTYGQEFDVSGGVRKSALQGYDLGGRLRSNGNSGETMATFGARKLAAGETMDINFIVRVYFTKVNAAAAQGGSGAGAPRRALTADNLSADGKYYVAEGTTTATLSDQIVTGLGTVKAQREAIGVTYINTIGQVSSTPWQGVNIIVTRYSDGSTTTTKVIR